jgi:four helix bundle protein
MMPYEKFEAWKVTHQLALEIYKVSSLWPASERYLLTAQIRRAALSVPTNIAEGAAKRGVRELVDISTYHRAHCRNSPTYFDSAGTAESSVRRILSLWMDSEVRQV